MKYNFDQVTDRSHTDATKWFVVQETLDIPDVTPLWIILPVVVALALLTPLICLHFLTKGTIQQRLGITE